MKSHFTLPATQLSHRTRRSSRPILLATLTVAATLFLTNTNRAVAQTQDAAAQPQATTSVANAPSATPAPAAVPAPAPQEAQLINPIDNTRFVLRPAADGSQGNSLTTAPAQSPHHGLAKTGAIVGTIVLGLGVGAFALAAGHCNAYNSGPCSAFHYGGIGAMAGGGALAATGFYFTFRK